MIIRYIAIQYQKWIQFGFILNFWNWISYIKLHLLLHKNQNTFADCVLVDLTLYWGSCLVCVKAVADPRGVPWVHGTPLLKGYLRKYCVQMYYVHYAHTGATHFNFNSSNNARVSTPVSRIWRVHTWTYILPEAQRQWAKRASKLKLIHALFSLQLGMEIRYQYEGLTKFTRLKRFTSSY